MEVSNVKTIGFLGPWGTFCEEAACEYNKKLEAKLVPLPTIERIMKEIKLKKIDEGVVPIENSIEGSVNLTLDLLVHECKLRIKGEIILKIEHNLLLNFDTPIEKIKRVYSHPQAIFQCRDFLNRNLPEAEIKYVASTAEGAERVQKDPMAAAIGSKRLAGIYNLNLAVRGIQSQKDNYTRFVVLAEKDHHKTVNDKTSIVFSVPNTPGSLYEVLKEFAVRELNLTKIESRPSKKTLGEYFFFLDIDGHRCDTKLRAALENIKKKCSFYKTLGSYPKQL